MKRTLMVILLVLILESGTFSQQKFISSSARPKNTTTFLSARDKYNEAATRFNAEFGAYKTEWDIEPNKLLPHIQAMRDQLSKMEETLLHLDEE